MHPTSKGMPLSATFEMGFWVEYNPLSLLYCNSRLSFIVTVNHRDHLT